MVWQAGTKSLGECPTGDDMTNRSVSLLRIADRAAGRDNNFNLLRMLAAAGVLISHAYPITLGPKTPQPLSGALQGITLGMLSVMVFFAISGFFITRSFAQKATLRGFLEARILRLFPALAVVLILTILVAGLFLTTASPGVFWAAAPEYFLRNLMLFYPKYELPGVFETTPFGPAINGSLWTLNYEVLCYLGVVLCGLLGLLVRPPLFAMGLVLFVATHVAGQVLQLHPRIENLLRLGLPFGIGMAFWVWRAVIPLSWVLAGLLCLAAALLRPTLLFEPMLTLALTYTIFVLGYARSPFLERYNRLGDYSYGTYVYAFPLQQWIAALGVVSPILNIALSLPLVLVCAILSWTFVEAPALRLRSRRRRGTEDAARTAAE